MKPEPRLPADLDIARYLLSLPPALRATAIAMLGQAEGEAFDGDWPSWAHDGQRPPDTNADGAAWATWVIKAGRGFGKTLAGAHWVTGLVATGGADLRIALVGATLDDARRVMVEGRSGLIAVAGAWLKEWHPSLRRLTFRTGAEATLFSGASPEALRGPEHHYAWCDELAKWERPRDTWDMLQLGLRLGDHPRALVTTTPRAGAVLRAIMAEPGTVTTGGATRANPHLSPAYQARVAALYAGTRLGRQELDGELLPDAAGALWTVELIARSRLDPVSSFTVRPELVEGRVARDGGNWAESAETESPAFGSRPSTGSGRTQGMGPAGRSVSHPRLARTLIAVDPPAGDGTCGIVACAREGNGAGAVAHVLADHSVTARSPEGWADAAAAAAAAHATREVVAEANQGGKMVKAVLHNADPTLHVRLVTATKGKSLRAEPIAHLFEAGRVRLHGAMPELEAQLLGMIAGGGYEGPGTSPDRADAMVWGVGEVMREMGVRVRGFER